MVDLEKTLSKSMLADIIATVTADSEDDYSRLLQLMQPTDDRQEMGEVYNHCLGYNPITYFDERYLRKTYKDLMSKAPLDVKALLEGEEDRLIEETMTKYDGVRDYYLATMLARLVSDETGWIDPEFEMFDSDEDQEDDGPSQPKGFEFDDDDDDDEEDGLSEDDDEDEDDDDESSIYREDD